MTNLLSKINLKTVISIGGYAVTGVVAVVEAIDKTKQAKNVKDLMVRVAELEQKVNK